MQGKQTELLIIFKVNVLRNYKNTEEMIAVDLLEKIGEHTKGEIANQCKKQVLKSGEVAGRIH